MKHRGLRKSLPAHFVPYSALTIYMLIKQLSTKGTTKGHRFDRTKCHQPTQIRGTAKPTHSANRPSKIPSDISGTRVTNHPGEYGDQLSKVAPRWPWLFTFIDNCFINNIQHFHVILDQITTHNVYNTSR